MDKCHNFEEGTASDSEDTLSLCDLSFPSDNPQDELLRPNNSPPEEDDSFNFSTSPNPPSTLSPIDSSLLFGKSIPYNKPSNLQYTKEDDEGEEEEKHQRSQTCIFRSDSFNRFSGFGRDGVKTEKFIADYYGRSNSVRLANKRDAASSTAIGSGSSRKYKALIGLTRFPAKMELNEIRRRQSRLPPAPMFAATSNAIGGKSLWGLVRPLRSRSHIVNALARASLGCIPRV